MAEQNKKPEKMVQISVRDLKDIKSTLETLSKMMLTIADAIASKTDEKTNNKPSYLV